MIDVHNNLISLTLKFPTKKAIPLTLFSIPTDYDGISNCFYPSSKYSLGNNCMFETRILQVLMEVLELFIRKEDEYEPKLTHK